MRTAINQRKFDLCMYYCLAFILLGSLVGTTSSPPSEFRFNGNCPVWLSYVFSGIHEHPPVSFGVKDFVGTSSFDKLLFRHIE